MVASMVNDEKKEVSGKSKRLAYITVVRIIAMCCVITPHLLAYRIDTIGMRYLAHYGLNRIHIIQFGGALGVSLFFITSGYLTMPQIGRGRYKQRFFKQIIAMMIEVFVSIMFCMFFSWVFTYIFKSINGYESYYIQYGVKDWISTGLLIRNIFYQDSSEAVLWFLVPFLFFKLLVLLYDICSKKLKKREERGIWFFIGFTIVAYLVRMVFPAFMYVTERFFYIRIIMVGYLFSLLHNGKISKIKFLVIQGINILFMLFDLEKTWQGIDDGYIVSVLYATVIFYVFYKVQDCISYNKVIEYFDKIGMSFFLLHNCVGYNFIQLFFNVLWNSDIQDNLAYVLLGVTVALTMLIITFYAYVVQPIINKPIQYIMKKIK